MAAPTNEYLQRLWLDQLLIEFNDICYQYRLNLIMPIIELSGAEHQLGCWLAGQRTIKISRCLITDHPWDVVILVFKHEMAHQVCSELLAVENAGHGREFQRACQMLGVPAPYNQSSGDLPDTVASPTEDHQTKAGRKIIDRVGKLLALAGSENEHEAALAMQRATELLHRHNLDAAEIQDSATCTRLIINTFRKQIPTYRRTICGILRDYFFVQIIYSSLYDPESNSSHKTIELLGRAENVPVAEHCYHFLEQQLVSLWQKNRHKFRGTTITAKNSYYLGLLHGFSQKLASQVKECAPAEQTSSATATPGALAISRDNQLQDFVSFHFPRLITQSRRGVRLYEQPYNEAVNTGKTIVLNQTVGNKKEGVQGLLPCC